MSVAQPCLPIQRRGWRQLLSVQNHRRQCCEPTHGSSLRSPHCCRPTGKPSQAKPVIHSPSCDGQPAFAFRLRDWIIFVKSPAKLFLEFRRFILISKHLLCSARIFFRLKFYQGVQFRRISFRPIDRSLGGFKLFDRYLFCFAKLLYDREYVDDINDESAKSELVACGCQAIDRYLIIAFP